MNNSITITSFYFADGKGQKAFPKKVEIDGQPITFASDGLRFLIERSGRLIQLFDMNDGSRTYRLRQENDLWTLVNKT